MTTGKQIGVYFHYPARNGHNLIRIANIVEGLGGSVFQINTNPSVTTFYFKISDNIEMCKFIDSIRAEL